MELSSGNSGVMFHNTYI